MNDQIKFESTVILVDVAILQREAANMRRAMSYGLKRELSMIDLTEWFCCLYLDSGMKAGKNDIQVILLHEEHDTQLSVCAPAELTSMDGMAFLQPLLGEFSISCVHPAGITDTPSLFFDLMYLALDSKDVKQLVLVPSDELYGTSVKDELNKIVKEKGESAVEKVSLFNLLPAEAPAPYHQQVVTLSLAHCLGITPDDVK